MSIFVNKTEITEEEVAQEMQYHPAQSQEEAWKLAAQSLVVRQLLLQQAIDQGLCDDDPSTIQPEQEGEIIDQLLQRDVEVPEADEATCRRFYDSHPDSFMDDVKGERLDFVQTQAHIRDYLHTKAMRMAIAEYIKALSYQAKINGFDLT